MEGYYSTTRDTKQISKMSDTYVTYGHKLALHGFDYQLKMLTYVALLGRRYEHFKLSTEEKKFQGFQNIVISYKDENNWKRLLLQVTHTLKKKIAISDNTLKSYKKPRFSILRYFEKFCSIKSQTDTSNNDTYIKEDIFILCTNNKPSSKISLLEVDSEFKNKTIFTDIGYTCYKLGQRAKVYLEEQNKGKIEEGLVNDFTSSFRIICGFPDGENLEKLIQKTLRENGDSDNIDCLVHKMWKWYIDINEKNQSTYLNENSITEMLSCVRIAHNIQHDN